MSRQEDTLAVALKLHELGYIPLHIDPDSKAARHQGWQNETPTEESIRRNFSVTRNLGVRCGDQDKHGVCLLAIDVDIDDAVLIGAVERAIGPDLKRVPVKRGKKGATYLIRYNQEQKTTKIKWERDGNKIDAIDILCRNAQTVIPPSVHPDTKLPYQYISGPKLHEIDIRTLPVFGPSLLDEIRGFCKNPDDPIYALNDMTWAGVGGGGNTHDTCVRAVSSMVGRKWTDVEIQTRVQRAKQEACENAGTSYNWPEAEKVIQEWIKSSRDKNFDTTSKHGKARSDEIPMEILNGYIYVQQLDRMYSNTTGMLLNKHVFDNVHARDIPKPWASVVCCPDFQMVERLTYSPGEPRICKEKSFDSDAVHTCLNLYRPAGIEAIEGDIGPFLELVNHVFDNDPDAIDHVLSFFSHMVQHPGKRINHALVIQGEQGIGKDTILAAIADVIGHHNYLQVTLSDVESDFNSWLMGRQLIVFQEMMAAGRRGIYNKLKTFITEPIVTVNEKHLARQRLPNRAVYVFLTNYKHAISIDHGDRRMWVWYSSAEKKPDSFFNRFNEWKADTRNVSALLYFLLNYDISKFRPYAPPPMTKAKSSLIENSASEVEQVVRNAIDSGAWPMGCDVVNTQHLYSALRPFTRTSLSILHEALENLGCRKLEQRPRIGGVRLTLWSIRNHDKWASVPPQTLGKVYRVPLPPQQGETEGTYSVYIGSDISEDAPEEQF